MDEIRPICLVMFSIVWIALGIAGVFLFYVNTDVWFKRKYFFWYMILAGVLFVILVLISGFPLSGFGVLALAIVWIIIFVRARNMKFCDSCSHIIADFPKRSYCRHCGAKIDNRFEYDLHDRARK